MVAGYLSFKTLGSKTLGHAECRARELVLIASSMGFAGVILVTSFLALSGCWVSFLLELVSCLRFRVVLGVGLGAGDLQSEVFGP